MIEINKSNEKLRFSDYDKVIKFKKELFRGTKIREHKLEKYFRLKLGILMTNKSIW